MNTSKTALRLSYIIAAILLLVPFHALLTNWLGSNVGHLDLIRIWKEIIIVAILPFVGWITWQTPQLKQWLMRSWVARLFGVYIWLHLVLGIGALIHHQVNATALIYALIINLRFVGFFLICALLAAKHEFLTEHWKSLVLWPAVVVIIFGILQVVALPQNFLTHLGYGPKTIPAYQTVDSNIDFKRIQSTLRGANPLGAYLVLIIPALLFIARRTKVLLAGTLLGAFFILYYSYSRSAGVGIVIALLVLAGFSSKLKLKKNLLAGMALAGLILIAVVLQLLRSNQAAQDVVLHTSKSSTVAVTSNEARTAALKAGARDVVHQPLGRGPGTAGPASFRNSGHQPRIAENYFLQIGQEVGVLGMVLLIGMMALVGKELWDRRNEELAKILLASIVGLTFVNLISHAWTDDTLAYLWWGLAGIATTPSLVTTRVRKVKASSY